MKRLATLVCVCALPFGAAACGGSATVNSDDVSATAVATGSDTPADGDASTTVTATKTRAGGQDDQGGPARLADDRAREVESIPEQGNQFTAEEQAFLTQLKENGLNIEGVEDQLTATGMGVCSDEFITRDAVAGQLVEQRRTDMDPDTLGQLLTDSARAHLC